MRIKKEGTILIEGDVITVTDYEIDFQGEVVTTSRILTFLLKGQIERIERDVENRTFKVSVNDSARFNGTTKFPESFFK